MLDIIHKGIQLIMPKKVFTKFAGRLARVKNPRIKNFIITQYQHQFPEIDMHDSVNTEPTSYATFNDFFARELIPGSRPIANAPVVSPVDGIISQIGSISDHGDLVQAKGKTYTIQELANCSPELAAKFEDGKFAVIYLPPYAHHRAYWPVGKNESEEAPHIPAGDQSARIPGSTLEEVRHIPGTFFSVNPRTVREIPKLFVMNHRLVFLFETDYGPVLFGMIGATLVGSFATHLHDDLTANKKTTSFDHRQDNPPTQFNKGEELAWFQMGGSTVVMVFTADAPLEWCASLVPGSEVHVGEALMNETTDHSPAT